MNLGKRIVCAAIRNKDGHVITGARHYDKVMVAQIKAVAEEGMWSVAEQGFIDNHGDFHCRVEAWKIAEEKGQIIRRVGNDKPVLYSENLY